MSAESLVDLQLPEQIMLDLETLGTAPGSVIVAIGATRFNGLGIVDKFYARVDAQSCVDAGLVLDVSTVLWWLNQSDEARKELTAQGRALRDVLVEFARFIDNEDRPHTAPAARYVQVWGCGANFDNALLSAAYRALGMETPWRFFNDRCYRTLKAMHPEVEVRRGGTHHNALDDAITQTLHLLEILRAKARAEART